MKKLVSIVHQPQHQPQKPLLGNAMFDIIAK
jgi:hypothetical protein